MAARFKRVPLCQCSQNLRHCGTGCLPSDSLLTLHDNEFRNVAVQCAKTGHALRCHPLHPSWIARWFPEFDDSDAVCRHLVRENQARGRHHGTALSLERDMVNLHAAFSRLLEKTALGGTPCRSRHATTTLDLHCQVHQCRRPCPWRRWSAR